MEELLLRMDAILRRSGGGTEVKNIKESYEIGSFHFECEKQTLSREKSVVKLTSKESELLEILCASGKETLEREYALKKIWGDDTYFNARSMDVYITKLRKYFKSDPVIEIVNVHGKGFKLLGLAGQN